MKKLLPTTIMLAFGLFCVISPSHVVVAQQRNQNEARSLTGRVLNPQDGPVQRAIVYLKNTKTLAIKTYISEPDGSFRFAGLASNIDYELYAELNGSHSDTKTLSAFDNRKQVNMNLHFK